SPYRLAPRHGLRKEQPAMATPEERPQELRLRPPAPGAPGAASVPVPPPRPPPAPVARLPPYVPCFPPGSLVYVSGQVPMVDGKPSHLGHLGDDVDLEDGRAAARTCAVNVLAALKAELGELSRVRRVVKVTGFVASAPGFTDMPKVVNAASELFGEVFGDAGRHARAAGG